MPTGNAPLPRSLLWIVRFVANNEVGVRLFDRREAAEAFIEGCREGDLDVRSWAEVTTVDLPLPPAERRC